MNIGIATKNFGQGTVTITASKLSGYGSGLGKPSVMLWRRIIEMTAHAIPDEPIVIGLLDFKAGNYSSLLYDLSPVSVELLGLDTLVSADLGTYDLLFVSGLPDSIAENARNKIRDFVLGGGGLLIECPDMSGEINVLSQIESVEVSSIQPPFNAKAYWTESGRINQIYTENAETSVDIQITGLDQSWNILVSDVETPYAVSPVVEPKNNLSDGSYVSLFSAEIGCHLNNGIVIIGEST